MDIVNPLKETIIMGTLNVGLPTIDVYSDIALSMRLYSTTTTPIYHINSTLATDTIDVRHPFWASSLLIPFIVNYMLGWYAWVHSKWTRESKKLTWIFAILGCYPQLLASRLIWLFWTKPKRAEREKKHFERNVMQNEVYTEAVPISFIMIFLSAASTRDEQELIIGTSTLAIVTLNTSLLSASLGLAKCLKVGLITVISFAG